MSKVALRVALMMVVAFALGFTAQHGQAAGPAPLPQPATQVEQAPVPAPGTSFDDAIALREGGTCEDFGMFEHNKRDDCNKSCKRGRTCVKKQMCGEGTCPDPGYCWKCAN